MATVTGDHGDRRRRTGRLQSQTQQSFDSRLLCRVLYSHFRHICLTKNTRPINPFNLSFSVITNLKSKRNVVVVVKRY